MNSKDTQVVNEIKMLALDMINMAGSGHPGIVLSSAPILYTLYANHLRYDINNPNWINRDRFVMSCGHGSALLYATLHMAGFNISINDLKTFRRVGSITPGHPEYGVTPGVECSTGPLGQGIAQAVGMALAERYIRGLLDQEQEEKQKIIDSKKEAVDKYFELLTDPLYLDQMINEEEDTSLGDIIPSRVDVEEEILKRALKEEIEEIFNILTPKEILILKMYWGICEYNGMNYSIYDIARIMKTSPVAIEKIETKARNKIKIFIKRNEKVKALSIYN